MTDATGEKEAGSFFEHPILNSPYAEPTQHHALDAEGQPLDERPRQGRRRSELITPVPRPKKKKRKAADQPGLDLSGNDGVSSADQEYNPTPMRTLTLLAFLSSGLIPQRENAQRVAMAGRD